VSERNSAIRRFLALESASGIILLATALGGLIIANSPLKAWYHSLLDFSFQIGPSSLHLTFTVLKVINYILMTLFFFVVGLEIKRELTGGHLSSFRAAIMPFLGAIGGMVLPAVIYLLIAGSSNAQGWAVPVATDIALAVGAISLIGKAVAPSLRSFLLALAVIDDIGAILIIAIVYSSGIQWGWVLCAILAVAIVVIMKRVNVTYSLLYLFPGSLVWYCLYRCGVHPTLAGVILGLLTPTTIVRGKKSRINNAPGISEIQVIEKLEHRLHPLSSFLVIPLFAFANAGVEISSDSISTALNSAIAWGIFFGLVLGKPLGILVASILAIKANIGDRPAGASKLAISATGSAAGIGFTVAIFIAHLAFASKAEQDVAIIAIIVASIVSGLLSKALFAFNERFVKDR